MFQIERGLSGALTPDPTSWVGDQGRGAEKGERMDCPWHVFRLCQASLSALDAPLLLLQS
ncbi:hypothetical protein Q5P01_006048 [Channa striata]|uniref:Uncharacterized protein n=1 Tax=Channa striata TaxID=64152 RepID=A0AA88N7A5_CHASR|nr:hypothetical protein Q5P01_006048 [Channa striata]